MLGPADAAAFRRIRLEALLRHPDAFGASHAEAARQDEGHFAGLLRDNAIFGAERDGRLAGTAAFSRLQGEKARHKGVMWAVYVEPAQRGERLGEQLVQAVIDHARQHVRVLQCSVVAGNATARDLYLRLGFRPYGTERRALRLGDRFLDEDLLDIMFDDDPKAAP
jgi:L-amino acid N-acyltransferase YncA